MSNTLFEDITHSFEDHKVFLDIEDRQEVAFFLHSLLSEKIARAKRTKGVGDSRDSKIYELILN